MTATDNVNDFLLAGGVPSAKFPNVGTLVKGVVVSSEVTQQTTLDGTPKTFDNGDPMRQVVITLQTDERDPSIDGDDGQRKLYVKSQMTAAVREALRNADAKLEVGGVLAVKFDSEEPNKKAGLSPKKVYVAQYKPPAPSTADANDLLGAGNGAAPATPAADDLV